MWASTGVRPPLDRLQRAHAVTMFSQVVRPPRERGITWLEPRLVAQVGFMERTGDGRLRHPVFLGLRDDKAPAEVRWTAQTA
jgi:bifunctional non-homologous end joining protein LigD